MEERRGEGSPTYYSPPVSTDTVRLDLPPLKASLPFYTKLYYADIPKVTDLLLSV